MATDSATGRVLQEVRLEFGNCFFTLPGVPPNEREPQKCERLAKYIVTTFGQLLPATYGRNSQPKLTVATDATNRKWSVKNGSFRPEADGQPRSMRCLGFASDLAAKTIVD